MPKGRADIDQFVDKLINSSKWRRLFGVFSEGSVEGSRPHLIKPLLKEDRGVLTVRQGGEERVTLNITGMHCASCAGIIERSLKKFMKVNVNLFAAEKARVIYDRALATTDKLIDAVSRL